MSHKIAVVLGTAREGNASDRVVKFLKKNISDRDDFEVEVVKVSDHLFSKTTLGDDDVVKNWKKIVSENDAFIFVTPEYNHSFPGELKILLDSLYKEYKGKVATIAGVTMGPVSGARMVESLKILLHTLNFEIAQRTIGVGNVQKSLSEEGKASEDSKDSLEKQLSGVLEEITEKLK